MRPPMDVVLYSCCVVQKGERRREGGRGWPGTVPRSPAAHKEKKERKKQARYLIDQYGERGKATTKKKRTNSTSGNIAGLKSEPCGTPEVGKNRLELNEEFRGRYKDKYIWNLYPGREL
jgi:hypothetical protein